MSASHAEPPLRLGSSLRDKWRLDELLGRGGMATVYAATHRNGSRAAIKVLHRELAREPETRERFRREGYLANRVDHPGVVRVLDDDVSEDGLAFLVMELLSGRTVKERWVDAGRRLPLSEALGIAESTLDILARAHERGVVHRDLKPDNLFIEDGGRVRLLDFGIARLRESATAITLSDALLGTPAFMAPEQALAHWDEVDARTDLFALCATLWTLTTGTLVHRGSTQNELLVAAATRRARPFALVCPDAPAEVAALIDRGLELERDRRWPSATELAAAVRRARAGLRGGTMRLSPDVAEGSPAPEISSTTSPSSPPLDSSAAPVETSEPAPSTDGTTIGRFRLLERIGRGGMGEVFRAHDTALERDVAIKILAGGGTAHDDLRARRQVLREARTAAALHHPNVIDIFEVGDSDLGAYIAMELVSGRSLAQLIPAARELPLERRLRWLLDLARALSAAHERGVVHRDIKPENVFVTDAGIVKVLDFGIAKRADEGDPASARPGEEIVGTPLYMAPEQSALGNIDARADQFAWAVLACELLLGVLLRAPDAAARKLGRAGVSSQLVGAVARALSPRPDDRFPTMTPIIEALESALLPPAVVAPPARGTNRLTAAIAVTASVIAIGVGGLWLRERLTPVTVPAAPDPSALLAAPATVSAVAPTATPTASISTSASASASVTSPSRPVVKGCYCRRSGGNALCRKPEGLACTCLGPSRFAIFPPGSSRWAFVVPGKLPAEGVGKPCSGVHHNGVTGGGHVEGAAESGTFESCSINCPEGAIEYVGSHGAPCRGAWYDGTMLTGQLDCPKPN